jgi:hypothetical protein
VVVTPAVFNLSLSHAVPPRAVGAPLAALWWAKKGGWEKAHRLIQDDVSREAARVHAYLHRAEGDLPNANYWYGKARQRPANGGLDVEWTAISAALLAS